MKQSILDALANVDPTNDEHWTADGVVRVDVVSELVGEDVTRADITAVAPKFNRKNTELTIDDGDVDASNEVTENNGKGDGEIPEPQFSNPWAKAASKAKAKLEEELVDVQETKDKLTTLRAERGELVADRVVIDDRIQKLDKEIDKLSQLCKQPELSLKEQLDMVLASEAPEVEERHKRRKLIKELMGSDKSLIDGLDMLD